MNIFQKSLTLLLPCAGDGYGAGRHRLIQQLVRPIRDSADRFRQDATATRTTSIVDKQERSIDSRTSPEQLQPHCKKFQWQ